MTVLTPGEAILISGWILIASLKFDRILFLKGLLRVCCLRNFQLKLRSKKRKIENNDTAVRLL
jgi:hypothetical protein